MSIEMWLARVMEVCLVVLAVGGLYAWRRYKVRWRARQAGYGFEKGREDARREGKL